MSRTVAKSDKEKVATMQEFMQKIQAFIQKM